MIQANELAPLLWDKADDAAGPDPDGMARDVASSLADIIDRKHLRHRADPVNGGIVLHAPGADPDDPHEGVWVRLRHAAMPEPHDAETIGGADGTTVITAPAYRPTEPTGIRVDAIRLVKGGAYSIGYLDQWPDPACDDYDWCADADGLCRNILASGFGIDDVPPTPPAGTYGPTENRMDGWKERIDRRLYAVSRDNLKTRAIEPEDECFHLPGPEFVTDRQMDRIVPEGIQRDRYLVMADDPPEPGEASLHWNDAEYWAGKVDEAVDAADENGVFYTNCYWEEEDYAEAAATPDPTAMPDPDPAANPNPAADASGPAIGPAM